LKREIIIDDSSPYAIDVNGSFEFDSSKPPDLGGGGKKGGRGIPDRAGKKEEKKQAKKDKAEARERKKKGLPPKEVIPLTEDEGVPFSLRGIDLKIPRGESIYRLFMHAACTDNRRCTGLYCWEGRYG
jgi:ATP-binding cassette subfamily C (CFTR/MRP) protein 1